MLSELPHHIPILVFISQTQEEKEEEEEEEKEAKN